MKDKTDLQPHFEISFGSKAEVKVFEEVIFTTLN